MGFGSADPKGEEVTVAPQSKSSEVAVSHEGESVAAPKFEDAGTFLRGGGTCDGEMQTIGSETSIPKGASEPLKPVFEKGAPGPEGPGVF